MNILLRVCPTSCISHLYLLRMYPTPCIPHSVCGPLCVSHSVPLCVHSTSYVFHFIYVKQTGAVWFRVIWGPKISHHNSQPQNHDKLARVSALHARWKYEDNEEEVLKGDALQICQRARCKELWLIVFGFTLHEAQFEAIHTLFYERKGLLLLAKTGFGKSLIFQLILFLTTALGVVLTLMPLKLLQAEQSKKINSLLGGKGIVLNR